MTTDQQDLSAWRGSDLVDSTGSKIGKIADIYLDEDTGNPEWVAVTTGFFGTRVSFVPLSGASARDNTLVTQFTKDQVKDAPHAEADGRLTQEEEARLYAHYDMGYTEQRSDSGLPAGGHDDVSRDTTGDTGHDTSGPDTDSAMTRSEEELRVGTRQQETGRVRLRKWVDTEHVSTTVPLAREEVRIEREPITDANVDRAKSGGEITEDEHEVVLYEEQAVTDKVTVPKERVRLDKDVVTEEERVEGEVRKENIEVEGDVDTARRDR